jgi:hypothetical protein
MPVDSYESQEVPVRVENTKLRTLVHSISSPIPLRFEFHKRFVPGGDYAFVHILDVVNEKLEIHSATIGPLQNGCFPCPIASCKHKLGALKSDLDVSVIPTTLNNFKTQMVPVKPERLREVGAKEFRDERVNCKHVAS